MTIPDFPPFFESKIQKNIMNSNVSRFLMSSNYEGKTFSQNLQCFSSKNISTVIYKTKINKQ